MAELQPFILLNNDERFTTMEHHLRVTRLSNGGEIMLLGGVDGSLWWFHRSAGSTMLLNKRRLRCG